MPSIDKLDLILDTNVVVAGLRSKRGASYQLLRLLSEEKIRLHLSVALALEYEDVLKRSGMLPNLTETQIEVFLDYIFSVAVTYPSVIRNRPILRDPDDERILEIAILSGATIVTYNTRDFEGCRQFGITIKTPAEVLSIIGPIR